MMVFILFQLSCICVAIATVLFTEFTAGLKVTQDLIDALSVVEEQIPFDPSFMDPGNFIAEKLSPLGTDTCTAEIINCNASSVYRTYDGTCNNLAHPKWGKAEDCHTRILEAYYEGAYDFRRSVLGGPLPIPRYMTLKEFGNNNRPTHNASFFFTVFGQMVSHEMTMINMLPDKVDCCKGDNAKDTYLCAPFYFPPDDPYYSKFNLTCLNLKRSMPCPTCISDKKQSINFVTATLDGSQFYGNSEKEAKDLRALDGTGRMRVTKTEFGELLPSASESDGKPLFCPMRDKPRCFLAGDARVNQHSPLMSVSTLFVREHNNVVDRLGKLNPSWDEETRYQEARRIVAAELQNIVYSEYLPALLGTGHMNHYNLTVKAGSKGTQYDPNIRLGIWNEFSTSIFRLHSMIATRVGFDHHQFKDYYSNVQLLREGKMDDILLGSCSVPSQKNDNWFVKDVSNHLYQDRYSSFGGDLVSLDLIRGRDNGIAPYVDVLRHLTNGRMNVSKFDDLSPLMPRFKIQRLKNLYKDVRDVDLFVGAIMENSVPGSQVGPTAAAILSMQFNVIKFGDRFYFEHEGQTGSFTPAQLESLKKVTLSRILCDNLRIKSIQTNPLFLESEKNPVVNCDEIPPSLDLSSWSVKPA